MLPHPHVKKPYGYGIGFLDMGVGERQARTSSKQWTSILQGPPRAYGPTEPNKGIKSPT